MNTIVPPNLPHPLIVHTIELGVVLDSFLSLTSHLNLSENLFIPSSKYIQTLTTFHHLHYYHIVSHLLLQKPLNFISPSVLIPLKSIFNTAYGVRL